MLQTILLGASFKRGWSDSIHDPNLLIVDFDLLHQRPDDLPPCLPVRTFQPLRDPPRELLQLTDHQPQFLLLILLPDPPLAFALKLGEALPRRQDPRLEFRLLDQAVSVGVDHPRDRLFYILNHLRKLLDLMARPRPRALQPPLVLRPDATGLGEEMVDVFPDGAVQDVGPDLLVPAEPLAAEPVAV
jgi:hypothetical protein